MVVVFSADVRENGSVTVAAKVPRYASGGEQEDHPSGYLLLEASGNTFDEAAAMLNATSVPGSAPTRAPRFTWASVGAMP